ncbi:Csu type fimbrial protein [Acinetobacter sp. Lyrl_1]|uniref:Csu type fimbrial protein n=1 Tax=Acinetobacter sp. Lyrl_1 TaxID=3110920 RepID=UPI003F7C87EA
MKNFFLLCLLMFAMMWSKSAFALCTVLCSCSVATTQVSFGEYRPLSSSLVNSNSGKVSVTCGGVLGLLIPYQIKLNTGTNSNTFDPRKMASGSNMLEYNLYTSETDNRIWGDGNGGTIFISGSVDLLLISQTTVDHIVYGKIPAGQSTVPPGTYIDKVMVTVTYQ